MTFRECVAQMFVLRKIYCIKNACRQYCAIMGLYIYAIITAPYIKLYAPIEMQERAGLTKRRRDKAGRTDQDSRPFV